MSLPLHRESSSPSISKESSQEPSRQWKIDARNVGDAILGLSDGLTVPFALTAGLSVLGNTKVVVLGGLAELLAGAISMGLGGYVGAKSEMEAYRTKSRTCDNLMRNSPLQIQAVVKEHFVQFGISDADTIPISNKLTNSPVELKDFLMKNYYDVAEPAGSRPFISALTLAISYILGGLLPLLPYIFVQKDDVNLGLYWSIGIMIFVLLIFGYVKTCVVRGWKGKDNIWAGASGAGQMLVVGGLAAGAAIGLVRLINGHAYQA